MRAHWVTANRHMARTYISENADCKATRHGIDWS
jgi:hypothetical protein